MVTLNFTLKFFPGYCPMPDTSQHRLFPLMTKGNAILLKCDSIRQIVCG